MADGIDAVVTAVLIGLSAWAWLGLAEAVSARRSAGSRNADSRSAVQCVVKVGAGVTRQEVMAMMPRACGRGVGSPSAPPLVLYSLRSEPDGSVSLGWPGAATELLLSPAQAAQLAQLLVKDPAA